MQYMSNLNLNVSFALIIPKVKNKIPCRINIAPNRYAALLIVVKKNKVINNAHPQPKKSKNTANDLVRFGSRFNCQINNSNTQKVENYLHRKNCLVVIPEDPKELFKCKWWFHFIKLCFLKCPANCQKIAQCIF